jgi:excisionase family DNA binding protein
MPNIPTPPEIDRPELLTVAEVATVLRVDPSFVYRACSTGEIRCVRLTKMRGGAVRVPASELQRLCAGARD